MRAMVLAAGFGTRLRPLTQHLPKPMFPILGRPVLEHILRMLARQGIREITVNLHHLPDQVEQYFDNGHSLGINLHYSREDAILGTAGGILKARRYLENGPFLVLNSDIVTDIDLAPVLAFHRQNKSALTMVLTDGNVTGIHDPIELDENGRVVHMVGASSKNLPEITSRVTFTGIQILEPDIFDRIPGNRFCGTTSDVYPQMIEDGLPVFGYRHSGYWHDMGTREQYLQVHRDALDGKFRLQDCPVTATPSRGRIAPPVWIGDGCDIADDASIGPYAVLGDHCVVGSGALIQNSVCWEGARVLPGARVEGSVIAGGVTVEENATLLNQAAAPRLP